MHINVRPTNLFLDDFTSAKQGISWFDEKKMPRIKDRVEELVKKFPEDIEIIKGLDDDAGMDLLGQRSAVSDLTAEVPVVEEVVAEEAEEPVKKVKK